MSGTVLVVMEQRGGAWNRMSFETLAAAQQLASTVGQTATAAIPGGDVDALAKEIADRKLDAVYAVEHALLAEYTADGYTAALEQLIRKVQPSFVLFPHTYQVRDFAPKLATRFDQALISDVIGIRNGGNPIFVRQFFQGKLQGDVKPGGPAPYFVSIQAGAFRAEQVETGTARMECFTPNLDASAIRQRPAGAVPRNRGRGRPERGGADCGRRPRHQR